MIYEFDLGNRRLDAMLDAFKNGVSSPPQLISVARKIDGTIGKKIGNHSEDLFDQRSTQFFGKWIDYVENNKRKDRLGIDRFIHFNNHWELGVMANRIIPVQVKSSQISVDSFRHDPRYKKFFDKKIIVINSSANLPVEEFQSDFDSEVRRIAKIIRQELTDKNRRSILIVG